MHIVYRVITLAEYDDYNEIRSEVDQVFDSSSKAFKYIEDQSTRDSLERFSVEA